MNSEEKLELTAQMCHEVNRVYCESQHDYTQAPWELTPANIQESARAGVRYALANPCATPADQHEEWSRFKRADGWVWGAEKNADIKTHPCLVPYDELPMFQRFKDSLFQTVVHTMYPDLARRRAEIPKPVSAQ